MVILIFKAIAQEGKTAACDKKQRPEQE